MSEHLLIANIPGFKRPRIYERSPVLADAQVCFHYALDHVVLPAQLTNHRRAPLQQAGEGTSQRDSQSEKSNGDVVSAPGTLGNESQGSRLLHKGMKQQRTQTGRKFTSQFRGVHQTFPTRRWEAQFRRGGRPTSLGCFDEEEQAAQAYDRMMLWCHLHGEFGTLKQGITNYDMKEYESEYEWLSNISQEELIESLRCHGRKQAASRHLRNKQTSLGITKSHSQDLDAEANVDADQATKSGSTDPASAGKRKSASEEPAADSAT